MMSDSTPLTEGVVPRALVAEQIIVGKASTRSISVDVPQDSEKTLAVVFEPPAPSGATTPQVPGDSEVAASTASWQYVLQHPSQPLTVLIQVSQPSLREPGALQDAMPKRARRRSALLDAWLEAKAEAFGEEA